MQIIPMRELKNTVEIERRCAEENGPVFVTKNGYGRLVVMDIDYYDRTMKEMEEAKLIMEGLRDVEQGRTVDGETFMKELGGQSMGFEYGDRFARQAAADVTGIVDYLAGDLANPTAAASFKKSLMECLDTLRMFPQSGSLVQNGYVPQTGIREKLVGNYLLFYQTDAETRTVYILRVVHGSRDLDRVVKNLT